MEVLILRHPQEQDKDLGTAPILERVLEHCTLKTGLSWRNFEAALGRKESASGWMVLFLGTGTKLPPTDPNQDRLFLVGKDKKLKEFDAASLAEPIRGVIVLDGNWQQVKALWWRNAWLLKLKRAVIQPSRKSLYGELRKEPRRECLSTLESVAIALDLLGEAPEVRKSLMEAFEKMLAGYQSSRLTSRRAY